MRSPSKIWWSGRSSFTATSVPSSFWGSGWDFSPSESWPPQVTRGIEALVKTGDAPSLSCLLDGIQVSTGCTMGKGNIRSVPLASAEADFSTSERTVTIRVKDEIVDEIKGWRERYATLEEIARSISKRPDEKLFEQDLKGER
jgi:formylmethanofuran dehydrogenase subunit E